MKITPRHKLYREWIYLISAALISVFFILFNESSFNDTLSSYGMDAFSLLNYDYFSFREKRELENEITDLKTRLIKSENERIKFAEAYDENLRLRELLSIEIPDSFEYIYARLSGIDPNSYGRTILINAGKEKNVNENDVVISKNGAVGIIINSGDRISKVKLISSPSNRIAVRTQKNRANGILIPADQDYASVEEITITTEVAVKESIYTADFSTIYPPGLLVGEVVSVSDSSATINKKIKVRFSQKFDQLDDVFVLKKKAGK
jgi:rod shape-determining protein MreC